MRSPWDDLRLLIPPPMIPATANVPYNTPFDVSESETSWVPPAPSLETALNIPTVAKLAYDAEGIQQGEAEPGA